MSVLADNAEIWGSFSIIIVVPLGKGTCCYDNGPRIFFVWHWNYEVVFVICRRSAVPYKSMLIDLCWPSAYANECHLHQRLLKTFCRLHLWGLELNRWPENWKKIRNRIIIVDIFVVISSSSLSSSTARCCFVIGRCKRVGVSTSYACYNKADIIHNLSVTVFVC